MKTINSRELRGILENHERWTSSGGREGKRASLIKADLAGANLIGANLSYADLIEANLQQADLSGAKLGKANLYGANLSGAILTNADLFGANIRNVEWNKPIQPAGYERREQVQVPQQATPPASPDETQDPGFFGRLKKFFSGS